MITITDKIYWTGSVDWNLREFHGYSTPFGTTYNSYLIIDEHVTLIDTVKNYGFSEMFARIKEVVDPLRIEYIISNHTEMDHSGSIDSLLKFCPQAQVVCSPKGQEGLKKHFKKDWKFKVVNNGDILDIGKRKLKFILTPMVHWPDSMFTYLEDEKILFSNDAFGQHYASTERFAEEVGLDIIFREAAKYYANIVMPYGNQVQDVLAALANTEIERICPSHGLIWRNRPDIDTIISLYTKWSLYESEKRAVIIYDTMWHSTEKIAMKLYNLIYNENIPVKLHNLQTADLSDIVTDIMRSQVVIMGTPILNNKVLPSMGKLLTYLRGLKPKNRYGLTFGSYGWSTVGFKEFEVYLKEAGMELLDAGKYYQYVPEDRDLRDLEDSVSKIKKILKP
jgi:flavorubredoxin